MGKCFFVAGEDSGDAHAAEVIREMRSLSPDVEVHGYGGSGMERAGAKIHFRLPELSSTGSDWIGKVFEFRRVGVRALELCRAHGIRTLVLVDFPGFNLRLATAAKRAGLRVIYYIIPQVWAWRAGRLKRMKRDLDLCLVLFPFEEELLREYGIPAQFVGHPLVDRLSNRRSHETIAEEAGLPDPEKVPLVGLLPGSRRGEVERLAPVLRDTAERLLGSNPDLHFVVPRAETIDRELLSHSLPPSLPCSLVENPAPDLRSVLRMAVTKSGTSTLENAVLGVPQVIIYKGRSLDAWVARRVIRVQWLGLVNILAGREICPEFLQENCVGDRIAQAARPLIGNTPERSQMLEEMALVAGSLGEGNAAEKAARAILERIRS
jgi:lipid-A-disaccharide synthase